jgi:hypothetical protein
VLGSGAAEVKFESLKCGGIHQYLHQTEQMSLHVSPSFLLGTIHLSRNIHIQSR